MVSKGWCLQRRWLYCTSLELCWNLGKGVERPASFSPSKAFFTNAKNAYPQKKNRASNWPIDSALSMSRIWMSTSTLRPSMCSFQTRGSQKATASTFMSLNASMIFCFFEDLHRQQNTLKEIRGSYKAGTCDLMLVSVFSNLAFNLIRRAEDKVISLDQYKYAKPLSQESLSLEIIYADSSSTGENTKARLASNERLSIKLFDVLITLQQLGL